MNEKSKQESSAETASRHEEVELILGEEEIDKLILLSFEVLPEEPADLPTARFVRFSVTGPRRLGTIITTERFNQLSGRIGVVPIAEGQVKQESSALQVAFDIDGAPWYANLIEFLTLPACRMTRVEEGADPEQNELWYEILGPAPQALVEELRSGFRETLGLDE
jgi:hypothetical protein